MVRKKGEENCWEFRYATSFTNNVRRFDVGRLDDILAIRRWLYEDACIYFLRKKSNFDKIAKFPKRTGISMEEAAELLDIHPRTFGRHVKNGNIKTYKEGMYRRLNIDDVESFKKIIQSADVKPWDKRLQNFGENNSAAKLTEVMVVEIKKSYKEGADIKQLSKKYDVSTTSIKNILNGKTWKHIIV